MAVRKTGVRKTGNAGKKPRGKTVPQKRQERIPLKTIFWILFLIILITMFFILLPAVKKNLSLSARQQAAGQTEQQENPVSPGNLSSEKDSPSDKTSDSGQRQQTLPPPPAAKPADKISAPEQDKPQNTAAEKPPESPAQVPQQVKPPAPPVTVPEKPPGIPEAPPGETREREIYFMRSGGADLQLAKVSRKISVSDSPLLDCLSALLAGPSAEEKNRGLVSFMPPNTRIISALVRGNTAYLNFNEDFRYNSFGREGSAAQIQQIVWTATEFPNVQDVQILIEGNRVDFLSEGVMIGSPLRR